LDPVLPTGRMDVIADLAEPLPCIVTAEMLGVPVEDRRRLKAWSEDFAEMLGSFQHNPDRAPQILRAVEEMTDYFRSAMHDRRVRPRGGRIGELREARFKGARLTEGGVIANCMVTLVGGKETRTNPTANGSLSLLRHRREFG